MLAAWQGIGGFTEERASLRTWLYKIATNRCLNARRAASRRPAREWDVSQFEPPNPTPRDEPVWLQPFPDALLEGAVDVPPGPEARYEQAEDCTASRLIARCLTWGSYGGCQVVFTVPSYDQLRCLVVLVDQTTGHFAPLDWQVQRWADLAVLAGWSLLAGLVRAVPVVMGGVLSEG